MKLIVVCIVFVLAQITFATQLTSHLTKSDAERLIQYFKSPYSDVEAAYYSILGLKSFNKAPSASEAKSACSVLSSCDKKSLVQIFRASSVVNALGASCKFAFPNTVIEFLESKINADSDVKSLYHAVSSLRLLGKKVDSEKAMSALVGATKKDNSVISSSLAMSAASLLDKPNLGDLLKLVDIEDIAAQADEVDEKYLHFENDLETTSIFLNAVFLLSEGTKQAPSLTGEQIVLFSNFLLRSKNAASSARDAFLILSALGRTSSSSQVVMGRAELVSGNSLSEERNTIKIAVTNVFGQPLTSVTVKADSIIRQSDNEVVMSNEAFKLDSKSNTYNLLFYRNKPKSGFYDVTLVVGSTGAKLIGISDIEFRVKVTTKVSLADVQLGVVEKEQATSKLPAMTYPKKSADLKADKQQKIVMKFKVIDLNDQSAISPHQVFVRFVHAKTEQEIIFIAEPGKDGTYKFEVELATAAKEQFSSVSGKYSMQLIVGDAAISNPMFWSFGDISLALGEEADKKDEFKDQYSAKPEIRHIFRLPEDRPPMVVSQAFTIACLLPLGLLFVMWAKIGANLNNIRLGPKNIIFHAGLGGIFLLNYFFWSHLNMFCTVQYLLAIGSLTFVFGNFVLSDLANAR